MRKAREKKNAYRIVASKEKPADEGKGGEKGIGGGKRGGCRKRTSVKEGWWLNPEGGRAL